MEGIFKGRSHRVADDLTDSAPTQKTGQCEQDRNDGFMTIGLILVEEIVDVICRTS